ncbi:UNVERIFIED_CONTAM: putative aquaporin NIP7-1 [Sesamum radiatum]|uniref:Aquaporin NIP7-1 n=1 Tax=Sesamum radiatum TaxID=300843 RepID=A0AAW2SAC8_SESRA
MTAPFQDSSSADISNRASTSSQPKNDRELGYITTSSNGNVARNNHFLKFPKQINTSLVRKVLAEALGTFILMFCIGGIVANMHFMGVEAGLLEYAATAGLTVTVIVFSIGSISGAHVNPAVTMAFAAVGPFPWSEVPFYVLAQVGGSVLATYTGKLVYSIKPEVMMTRPLHGCTSAFCVELISTFIILFLSTSLISEPQSACLGGSMNPARSLGPALVSWRFDHLWIYVVAPTIGAIAGVLAYRILRLQGWSCKPDPSLRTLQSSQSSLH